MGPHGSSRCGRQPVVHIDGQASRLRRDHDRRKYRSAARRRSISEDHLRELIASQGAPRRPTKSNSGDPSSAKSRVRTHPETLHGSPPRDQASRENPRPSLSNDSVHDRAGQLQDPKGRVERSRGGHGWGCGAWLDGEEQFGEGLRDPMSMMRYALKLWIGDLHEGAAHLPH